MTLQLPIPDLDSYSTGIPVPDTGSTKEQPHEQRRHKEVVKFDNTETALEAIAGIEGGLGFIPYSDGEVETLGIYKSLYDKEPKKKVAAYLAGIEKKARGNTAPVIRIVRESMLDPLVAHMGRRTIVRILLEDFDVSEEDSSIDRSQGLPSSADAVVRNFFDIKMESADNAIPVMEFDEYVQTCTEEQLKILLDGALKNEERAVGVYESIAVSALGNPSARFMIEQNHPHLIPSESNDDPSDNDPPIPY